MGGEARIVDGELDLPFGENLGRLDAVSDADADDCRRLFRGDLGASGGRMTAEATGLRA